jgi:hypothetical protein
MRQDLDSYAPWSGVECRHHRIGVAKPAAAVALVLAFGYAYAKGSAHPSHPVASSPKVQVVTRTITRTVVAHPVLSGTDWVLIILFICIAVVGSISLCLTRR